MKPITELSKEEALQELKYIAEEMAKSDIAYYQNNAPYLSDAEYDTLKLRNTQIENRFPELTLKRPPRPIVFGFIIKAPFIPSKKGTIFSTFSPTLPPSATLTLNPEHL